MNENEWYEEQARQEQEFAFWDEFEPNWEVLSQHPEQRRFVPENEVEPLTEFSLVEFCDHALARIQDYLAKA